MVVEIQQIENRIFWCGFGIHQDFCVGTVAIYLKSRTFLDLNDFSEIGHYKETTCIILLKTVFL